MYYYRPRSIFGKTIFDKARVDQYLDNYNTKLWYQINQGLPERYQSKFLALEQPDEATLEWLRKAKRVSSNIWLQIWHNLARTFLRFFLSQTDINGILKRGSMFILSENQFQILLANGGFDLCQFVNNGCESIKVLDIGAGDGEISTCLVKAVQSMKSGAKVKLYATESSWAMRIRLERRSFIVIDKIKHVRNVPLIACLNVLDRCFDPFELLQDIRDVLAPSGRVVIALVLPYTHYVEFSKSHLPNRPLMDHWPRNARKYSFEAEATLFFKMIENFGFKVESWTKAPYLCEGDLRQSFYWLIDIVVVLSKN